MKKFHQIKKYIIKIIYAVKDFNYYHAGSIIGSFPISAYPPSYYILSEEEKEIFRQDVERQKEELLEYIKTLEALINQGEIPICGISPLSYYIFSFFLSRASVFSVGKSSSSSLDKFFIYFMILSHKLDSK